MPTDKPDEQAPEREDRPQPDYLKEMKPAPPERQAERWENTSPDDLGQGDGSHSEL